MTHEETITLRASRWSSDWKQMLCACGHKRAAHSGKGHDDDCCETTDDLGIKFCMCKKFREHQFKNEEEIEMAKKNSKNKTKGERKHRERKIYMFDVERARELRDARYSSEAKAESKVGLMLRALISSNSEGYTADRIFELANNNGAKLEDVNVLPIGTLITYGVLSLTNGKKVKAKEIVAVAAKKAKAPKASKPKKARKPRKQKLAAEIQEAQTETQAAAD